MYYSINKKFFFLPWSALDFCVYFIIILNTLFSATSSTTTTEIGIIYIKSSSKTQDFKLDKVKNSCKGN